MGREEHGNALVFFLLCAWGDTDELFRARPANLQPVGFDGCLSCCRAPEKGLGCLHTTDEPVWWEMGWLHYPSAWQGVVGLCAIATACVVGSNPWWDCAKCVAWGLTHVASHCSEVWQAWFREWVGQGRVSIVGKRGSHNLFCWASRAVQKSCKL